MQKIEVSIPVPNGWKATGEVRKLNRGESGLRMSDFSKVTHHPITTAAISQFYYYVIERDVPTGKDLEGVLCGVSDYSIKDAKNRTMELTGLRVIEDYDANLDYPYMVVSGDDYKFAYPVSEDAIQGMLDKLRSTS